MDERIERVVKDAETYASTFGITICEDALAVLRQTEELACSLNTYVYPWTYAAILLKRVKEVRAVLARHGADPDFAANAFDKHTRQSAERDKSGTSYDPTDSFSLPYKGNRVLTTRARFMDFAIYIAEHEGSNINGVILFAALLAHHDDMYPFLSNGEREHSLRTPFNTLSHMLWEYEPTLFIKFDDLRNDLGLRPDLFPEGLSTADVPPSVRSALLAFRVDHPDYQRNCFLVMPFAETTLHTQIAKTLKQALGSHGFDLVRADENVYSEHLLTNIQAHIHGCRFAIAVFERILTNDFNPNVSLEVGYFFGLRKPVCLLKERTLPRLPTDLVGRLYVEFDSQDLERSLKGAVDRWLRERGLIRRATA